MSDDVYEVYGILYSTLPRSRGQALLGADPEDRTPMPVGYYIWVIRNAARTIVVDTGFEEAEGKRRGRRMTITPGEALARLGVDCSAVTDVILTHLHFDHAGNLDLFPRARFHLQEAEMAFVSGRGMSYGHLRSAYSLADIQYVLRCVFAGRVAFVDGDRDLFPGISVDLIGGHAKGLQCVKVRTARGVLVLASDTAHYYENLTSYQPFVVQHDIEASLRGYDRLRELAGAEGLIVPGHDLQIMSLFPPASETLKGIAVRLDVGMLSEGGGSD
jgi:glyoxylase-like metal-dependent hydrolase (beta-lactamase superfamily II)